MTSPSTVYENSRSRQRNQRGEVVTVDIFKQSYDILKEKARLKGTDTKHFINEALRTYVIDRDKVLQTMFPGLSIELFDKNRVIIKDLKKMEFINIQYDRRKDELYCEQDKSCCCSHLRFLWMHPEAVLKIPSS